MFFGRLHSKVFIHEWVQNIAVIGMLISGLVLVALIFYFKKWKWLWREWLTSLDPKKIGVMYLAVVALMLLKGFSDAAMMRTQQAFSVGDSYGYLSASHFQQIFTAHGATMIFFVGMGLTFASMNLLVPLQIGARDVAFPFLNALSFWLFAAAGMLLFVSLAIGKFAPTGWLSYPPLSGRHYNPGEGVDYWIWIVQIAGVGSTLTAINFLATILKMRCPGMKLMRMPLFTWGTLAALVLIIFAFPVLTATLAMLALDRYLGMHFFTATGGGNPMLYVNWIWAWGHPEVYILILPTFGIFSEVVATFSQKRLFGYATMVWAIVAITILSFIVWLHHFFTMGAGPHVNAFFGMMTMLIAIPTGVKIFNWLFTMYQGRLILKTPLLWFLGFIFNFTVGGMTGVLLSSPPIDYQMHNSLFLIAHFHGVLIGGMLFGFFTAYSYWFPKYTGFMLNERLGKYAFWCWFIGFLVAFMPLYMLGFMGATRRLNHYETVTRWQPLFLLAAGGAAIIGLGIAIQIVQIVVSIRQRNENRDTTGDPWNGRTLEWSTSSPPPEYNFAIIPKVSQRDAFWEMKQKGEKLENPHYPSIFVPTSSPVPIIIGGFALLLGFALTWYIWWLCLVAFFGGFISLLIRLTISEKNRYFLLPPSEIQKTEAGRDHYQWNTP